VPAILIPHERPLLYYSTVTILVLVYKTLQGLAPRYLGPLTRVVDLPGRRSLCSACLNRLDVPFVRLSTVGGRAFSVASPRVWNNLPDYVTAAETLIAFRHRIKTFLLQQSYSSSGPSSGIPIRPL